MNERSRICRGSMEIIGVSVVMEIIGVSVVCDCNIMIKCFNY